MSKSNIAFYVDKRVQVALVIYGLFICDFADPEMTFFSGTYPLVILGLFICEFIICEFINVPFSVLT